MTQIFREIAYLFRGFGFLQIVGVFAAISAVHVIGFQSAVDPLGPLLSTPANAAYILGHLVYAYALALMIGLASEVAIFLFQEIWEGIRASIKGSHRRVIVDEQDEREFFLLRLQNQISLTIVVYAWPAWIIALAVVMLLIFMGWASKKFATRVPKIFPNQHELEDYSDAITHNERMLRSSLLGLILLIAFLLGPLRVAATSGDDLVTVNSSRGEISGSLIIKLSDGIIIEKDSKEFVFISEGGLLIEKFEHKPIEERATESLGEFPVNGEKYSCECDTLRKGRP